MNELANLANRLPIADIRPAGPATAPKGPVLDGSGKPVRPSAIGSVDTVEQALALTKLDRALASEQAPRTDVPRGYYLDIVV